MISAHTARAQIVIKCTHASASPPAYKRIALCLSNPEEVKFKAD